MREHKYRCWDAVKKEMIYIKDGYFISFCTGDLDYWWVGNVNYSDGDLLFDSLNKDNAVMDYIGFKDKNGVEIYKGDIVKTNGSFINPIRFHGGMYYSHNGTPVCRFYTTEIIGNEMEHPELLNIKPAPLSINPKGE